MLALSIRQPWAAFIIAGLKTVENREWSTNVRGRILVHAGKSMTRREYAAAIEFAAHALSSDGEAASEDALRRQFPADALPRGGIVGTVRITDCVQSSRNTWFVGKYGFLMRDPIALDFLPHTGELGFFRIPMDPNETI